MKITLTVTKVGKMFMVDNVSAPGSPPIGRGSTVKAAIGDWVCNNQTFEFDLKAIPKTVKEWSKEARRKR